MSKITLRGHIVVPDSDLDEVIRELPTHMELTRNESGCLVFSISQDQHFPNRFNVYEEFVDKASFSAHQERVRGSKWGEITRNVERNYVILESEEFDGDTYNKPTGGDVQ